ncbi:uncharacterized protein LOC115450495 [Manduca sexta]|uniref:uncharacterized protein LOC115450495 n=1 Tax=Manduca sexta TaxID=7130 RepID=UPI00188EB495|nr:uncharacterized protein LOC115450495 [Manduca sexta]
MESSKDNVNDSCDNTDGQNYSNISVKIYDEKSVGGADEVPTVTTNNLNELKVLDFYSADDVRQSIKSVLAGKGLYKSDEIPLPKIKENTIQPISKERKELHKEDTLINSQVENNVKEVTPSVNNDIQVQENGRKRRGRPIKPGPSKNPAKRYKIEDFYVGKLSNFVHYKRKGDSESDFDSESGVLY